MKNWMIIIAALLMFFSATAQSDTSSENDPKAKVILDKLKAKYDKFLSLEVNVNLTIEIPEQDDEKIQGKMVQSGEKFRVEMGDYIAISDSETLWTVMKQNQVVQISDATEIEDSDGAFMSPKDLVDIYQNGDYNYILKDETRQNGVTIQSIEFKPTSEDSEFFKIRILVDKDKQIISRIKVFSKDGTRYILDVEKFRPNKIYDSSYFEYDDSICPDCDIENLKY